MLDRDTQDLRGARSLSKIPLFKDFTFAELAELRSTMEVERRNAGAYIIRENQVSGRDFYIMVEGEVKIEAGGIPLATRGPDTVFGEIAFVSNCNRTASVIASTDCVLLRVQAERVKAMITRNPMVAWKLMEAIAGLLCDRYTELDRRVRSIMAQAPASLQEGYAQAQAESLYPATPEGADSPDPASG
jgi:CRP-like cAMP-binding protein